MAMLPITRATDADFPHCSGMVRTPGDNVTVFAGGLLVSRHGDPNTIHASNSVFVQKRGVGRIFDPTCTAVAQGLPTVFVGDSFSDFF